MSAGLPGLGLGGLFFILSALLAPFIEIGRIALGRPRAVDWPGVWRQFALALAMILAVDLTLRSIYAFSDLLGFGDTPRIDVITVIPLIPVAITACLLAAVLLAAKAVDLATPVLRGLPPISAALPSRTRVLAVTGAVGAIWFALLFSGASDLARLPGRDGGSEGASAGPAPVDSVSAGDTVALAGAQDDPTGAGSSDEAAAATAVAEESPADATAVSSPVPESDIDLASAAPTSAPVPGEAPPPGDAVALAEGAEPPAPLPSSNAPDAAGPQTAPPQTAAPPPVPSPPGSGSPPAHSGPPAGAGPPEHSNAPPHAGPG